MLAESRVNGFFKDVNKHYSCKFLNNVEKFRFQFKIRLELLKLIVVIQTAFIKNYPSVSVFRSDTVEAVGPGSAFGSN